MSNVWSAKHMRVIKAKTKIIEYKFHKIFTRSQVRTGNLERYLLFFKTLIDLTQPLPIVKWPHSATTHN